MKIPKKFNLLYKTVTIEYSDTLSNRESSVGMAYFRLNKIQLQSGISEKETEATFIHELTHFVLEAMKEKGLNDNEKFVELFSSLLYQALSSAEYK